jgi:long-chain acyl-CoA synthetase
LYPSFGRSLRRYGDGVSTCGKQILTSVNLADVFVGLASRWGDRPAVISPSLKLSYRELIAHAAQSARELHSRGVVAGSRVGIAINDSAEAVALMIAIWMLGATAVPIDVRTNAAGRALLAGEFDLGAILEDRQMSAEGYNSILVDGQWSDLIARHDSSRIFASGEPASAFISLTSGTTAQPIGIVLDHDRALLRFIINLSRPYGACLLNPIPLSFSASRGHAFRALLHGSAVISPPVRSVQELAEAVVKLKATSLCVVPTFVRTLLQLFGERSSPIFDRLQALYCMGAPMFAEEKLKARTVLSKNFVEDYGSNLCGRISSLYGSDLEARADTLGRVLPFVALQIVDGNDKPVPAGEAGNIRVRSPGMARTIYGGKSRASGDSLKDGWAYPGDIGSIDDKGFLRVLGRASDLIIRGGAHVHPAEVERVIAQHQGVQDVAVVGVSHLPEGEEIVAFVVGSGNLTEAALAAHCRACLSPDKCPRKFVFVRELPRNANGKIVRAKLRQQLETAG